MPGGAVIAFAAGRLRGEADLTQTIDTRGSVQPGLGIRRIVPVRLQYIDELRASAGRLISAARGDRPQQQTLILIASPSMRTSAKRIQARAQG